MILSSMEGVTLKMIAARVGVSMAAVSMGLRGRGTISRKRAEEIRRVAEEMGYRPNPLLSSLASKRFRSVKSIQGTPLALFMFPPIPGGTQQNFYGPLLMAEARKLGYAPKIYDITAESDPQALYRELYHRMVQGIVISGSMDEKTFGKDFDWSQFSVVQCARFHALNSFHTVRSNIFQSVKSAFTQLRERGYLRIGFAMGRHLRPMEDDEARYGTAISLESTYLSSKDRLPVFTGTIGDGESFLKWFDRWKPDAVIGFSGRYYWLLKDHGVSIPKHAGFVSMHLTQSEEDKVYSGLCQDIEGIARHSIRFLDQLIRDRERGPASQPVNLLVSSIWNEGKTLRKMKKVP